TDRDGNTTSSLITNLAGSWQRIDQVGSGPLRVDANGDMHLISAFGAVAIHDARVSVVAGAATAEDQEVMKLAVAQLYNARYDSKGNLVFVSNDPTSAQALLWSKASGSWQSSPLP